MTFRLALTMLVSTVAAPAIAQVLAFTPLPAPTEKGAIPLDTGGVEGVRASESWFALDGKPTVRNVATATLTPFLPARDKATGAAVIVAPGGGFLFPSMDTEGWSVARWPADHGLAAFVLKYRIAPTAPSMAGFTGEIQAMIANATASKASDDSAAPPLQVEDAQAALALVRRRADEWRVESRRVGLIGFSAGAITTLDGAVKASFEMMPAFIGPIYGSMNAVKVPDAAPPMFNALAVDDPLFGNKGLALIDSWQAARKPVEFHLYQGGSHGFGMGKPGTTSAGCVDDFHRWLDASGFLKAGE